MTWRWLKVVALGAALVLTGAPVPERWPSAGRVEFTLGVDHAEARPRSGGSRSSGFGVGAALARIGREERGAGVARGSRFRSEMAVLSEFHVLFWLQVEFVSWSWVLRGMSRLYWRLWDCV